MPDGYSRTRGADIVNVPNVITFARLCALTRIAIADDFIEPRAAVPAAMSHLPILG